MTQPQPDNLPDVDRLAGVFGYCHWCEGYASNVRIVATPDREGGPKRPLAGACPQCRALNDLKPISDPS
ncbi:MAG: hypothetical protein HOV73_18345 [Streptomyces sp.]|nr:hypothetical protein [Streptomyces sp.]NUS24861.1 hypothetical protein [Streptomyces sp.]NUS25599.1 hypothetical protein [Streptomyces sp.]NUS76581.1 hypothetical protein [Streptomyces sp.]